VTQFVKEDAAEQGFDGGVTAQQTDDIWTRPVVGKDPAKILVAEEESDMKTRLVTNLAKQGYQVRACQSGKKALNHIQQTVPDVVISDFELPDGSGLEILEHLKKSYPEVSFILATGDSSLETAVEALNQGAFAYITKPFNLAEVFTVIRNALKLQRVMLENRRLSEDLQQWNEKVTEHKRAHEALSRLADELAWSNNELEQFAYLASHDLYEPLRTVSSYLRLLEKRYKGKLDEDADDFIRFAMDGTTHMRSLINDLLAYSRVGTRGNPFESVDCSDTLKRVLENLKVCVEETGATVTYESLPEVTADAIQLAQLFQNLISNSLKFHGDVPPEIHIGAEQKNGEWLFWERDNGIGIEHEHSDRIFLIFQRLHTRSEYPGTGIGLAICKKIVERHAGRIWVESEPGNGSTFYFTIPVKHKSDSIGTGDEID